MTAVPTVILKPKKARPFFGRHPWVYHSAIDRAEGKPDPGQMVKVLSNDREFIAYGLYNENSNIRVRLYSWDKDAPIDADLVVRRVEQAIRFRHVDLGFGDPKAACRLVYSESDALSGLIVDRYADVVVVQFTSLAMQRFEAEIVECLERMLQPRAIYRRTERGVGELEGLDIADGLLAGDVSEPVVIVENGLEFLVDVREGQKTGAFLDQRDNRLAICRYARGRRVLDAFCYGGGFALTAAKLGGATSALGVDVSGSAIALAQQNADRNGVTAEFAQSQAAPYLQEIAKSGETFGMVILDPPKFARTAGAVEQATRGYEQINRLALQILEPGGILVTCSCSGHISPADFAQVLVGVSQKQDRELRLLEQRGQAPDHPVSVYCLETAYLKCFVARVAP